MSQQTKIALSAKERELVLNKEWILTKHIIIEKVYQLFGALALSMQEHIAQHAVLLPEEIRESNPKISKGENYRQLPYVMLDYPRHFTKRCTVAIRTLFWWGNFFSINLHLSGTVKEKMEPALNKNFGLLKQNGYWLCIHTDPWQHHFEEDNYVSLENYSAADFAAVLHRETFIKIAKRVSLVQWDTAPEFLAFHFKELIALLQINSPAGERGPLPGIPTTGSGL